MNFADQESIRVMKAELAETEEWLQGGSNSTSEDYHAACERCIELRKRLWLPEGD